MKGLKMPDDEKKTTRSVTMPAKLWAGLKEIAEGERRTVNAQICVQIEAAIFAAAEENA